MKRIPYKEAQQAFGKRVKELRKLKKLSQEKLAHLVDSELSTINRIELGKAGTSFTTILAISEALGVHPKALFDFELPKRK
jgi:transcriptional regulator with XRE-family HTH domain